MDFGMNPSNWTEGAKFCYRRGCRCYGCYVREILETRCFMKVTVFRLIDKFGAPPPDKIYTPAQEEIINAIKDGAKTRKDIAAWVNKQEVAVQGLLQMMYEQARTDGFRPKNPRSILPEYVEWVKENL